MTATTLTCESLLEAVVAHREADQLSYFGALLPQEAAALLVADPQTCLVDVRTRAELDWAGMPDISPGQFVHVGQNQYSGGAYNANSLSTLEAATPKDTPMLFLYHSAMRSKYATMAAAQAGYVAAMDVLEGSEGAKDTEGHRKTVEG